MVWSHFDNDETLNSNTSALVLLRLDTSPKRVALLTAPNPLCYLFVWIKAKKTLFCHFWKYKQLEQYCYCDQVRCRAVWHNRRQLFPEAVSFIQRPLHHGCARFLKTFLDLRVISNDCNDWSSHSFNFNHCALHIIPIYRCQGIVLPIMVGSLLWDSMDALHLNGLDLI